MISWIHTWLTDSGIEEGRYQTGNQFFKWNAAGVGVGSYVIFDIYI